METQAETNWNFDTHNGIVTLVSPRTGNHRTFRIYTRPEDSDFAPGKRVLYLLIGPDQIWNTNWKGFAFVSDRGVHVWKSKRGDAGEKSKFEIYADMIENREKWQARGVEYKFEGRCRVCNRTLTNPESIDAGIGPVCAEKV